MSNSGYNRPQRRRNMRRGLASVLIVICILMLLADRQQKSMLASGRLVADDVSSKIMGVMATPVRGIEAMFISAEDRKNAYKDNIALRAEVERLRGYENRVLEVEMQLQRFEEMLSLEPTTNIKNPRILARAVSESKGPFVHSALINAGKNKGIASGNAVMTTDGLYGHVVRSGSVSARILLINDLSSRISVMSGRSQSRALLLGNNTDQPKLAYVSLDADWQIGDRVITSGDGGVLPRGLQIGTIVAGKSDDIGNNDQLFVAPFYLNNPVDWVWVYPFSPIAPPEEEVTPDGSETPQEPATTQDPIVSQPDQKLDQKSDQKSERVSE